MIVEEKARPSRGRSSQKREEVLAIAAEYFLANGFAGTSINVMAKAASISKESIYRYFRSKEELFEAVIDRQLNMYQKRMSKVEAEYHAVPLAEALERVAETVLEAVNHQRSMQVRQIVFSETPRSPELGAHYYAIGPQMAYTQLERILNEHADKLILEPAKLSRYFLAMVSHDITLRRQCGILKPLTRAQLKKLAQEVVADFLKAFSRSDAAQ
jgi:AcrR family transcriptional regulator